MMNDGLYILVLDGVVLLLQTPKAVATQNYTTTNSQTYSPRALSSASLEIAEKTVIILYSHFCIKFLLLVFE